MRYLYWLLALPLMILAVLFAISNMGTVEISLWPFHKVGTLPLYLLTFSIFGIGFFLGGFVSWLGTSKIRRQIRAVEGQMREDKREMAKLSSALEQSKAINSQINNPGPLIATKQS